MRFTLDRAVDATPTDLQRDYKRLLTLAEDGGVVNINQRGHRPSCTLVSKEAWLDAMMAKSWLSTLSAVVKYATGRILNDPALICPSDFSWLQLYNTEDIRGFVDELSGAINSVANRTLTWDDVDAIVEEWSRSAALLEHEELVDRFRKAKEKN
ncbi:MAG TPA: hypothetical protein VFE16_02375 [Candidatus Cybelea sp.]|nr:hypothetical protein [Candidatus Cybelea sp.]